MLDQIEFQVKSASDFVDEGNVNMVSAVELQKSLRYKQLCCCIIAIVIIGTIIGSIYLYTSTGKYKYIENNIMSIYIAIYS